MVLDSPAAGIARRKISDPVVNVPTTPLFVTLFVMFLKRDQWRARRQHPFREFNRRPAGEALRLKVMELDEKLVDRLVLFTGVPAMLWTVGPTLPRSGRVLLLLAFLASSVWVAIFGRKIYRLARERSDYQLGFDGERYVGEALTPLVSQGFEIYPTCRSKASRQNV